VDENQEQHNEMDEEANKARTELDRTLICGAHAPWPTSGIDGI
jgi:hypothetical protein